MVAWVAVATVLLALSVVASASRRGAHERRARRGGTGHRQMARRHYRGVVEDVEPGSRRRAGGLTGAVGTAPAPHDPPGETPPRFDPRS